MGDDGIVLTDRERQALAGLAESIGDPWLAGQLAGSGGRTPSPTRKHRRPIPALLARLTGWVGLLLTVVGAVLTATTFMHSTVIATLGLAVMGFGLWRLAADRSEAILGRLRALGQWRGGTPTR